MLDLELFETTAAVGLTTADWLVVSGTLRCLILFDGENFSGGTDVLPVLVVVVEGVDSVPDPNFT